MERFRDLILATLMLGILIGVCGFQEVAAFQKIAAGHFKLAPLATAQK